MKLFELPDDLIHYIYEFLDVQEWIISAETCPRLYDILEVLLIHYAKWHDDSLKTLKYDILKYTKNKENKGRRIYKIVIRPLCIEIKLFPSLMVSRFS